MPDPAREPPPSRTVAQTNSSSKVVGRPDVFRKIQRRAKPSRQNAQASSIPAAGVPYPSALAGMSQILRDDLPALNVSEAFVAPSSAGGHSRCLQRQSSSRNRAGLSLHEDPFNMFRNQVKCGIRTPLLPDSAIASQKRGNSTPPARLTRTMESSVLGNEPAERCTGERVHIGRRVFAQKAAQSALPSSPACVERYSKRRPAMGAMGMASGGAFTTTTNRPPPWAANDSDPKVKSGIRCTPSADVLASSGLGPRRTSISADKLIRYSAPGVFTAKPVASGPFASSDISDPLELSMSTREELNRSLPRNRKSVLPQPSVMKDALKHPLPPQTNDGTPTISTPKVRCGRRPFQSKYNAHAMETLLRLEAQA